MLEPIVNMEITVPGQYMGDIAGDLSGPARADQGQDMLPGGMCVVKAIVPLVGSQQLTTNSRASPAARAPTPWSSATTTTPPPTFRPRSSPSTSPATKRIDGEAD